MLGALRPCATTTLFVVTSLVVCTFFDSKEVHLTRDGHWTNLWCVGLWRLGGAWPQAPLTMQGRPICHTLPVMSVKLVSAPDVCSNVDTYSLTHLLTYSLTDSGIQCSYTFSP